MKDSILDIKISPTMWGEFKLPNIPLYKGFRYSDDRDNFLKGNVWFAGKNTNRDSDIWEYRSSNSQTLFLYALSLSKTQLQEYPFHLKISNTRPFFYEIKNALLNSNLGHDVSWHPLNYLKRFSSEVPFINTLTENDYFFNASVKFMLNAFWAQPLSYINKRNSEQNNNFIYNSFDAAKISYLKNDEFNSQEEHRLIISGFFTGANTGHLDEAVKHLKIKCPQIKDFCEILN